MKYTEEKFVMLIDDSPIDNYVNTRMIEQSELAGSVVVMESGKEGLDFIKKYEGDLVRLPDIIFLDLNMPVVDGFDFLTEFNRFPDAIKKKCKIVVLTSSDKTEDIHFIINNQLVRRYLIKPLSQDSLDELKKLLK